MKERELLHWQIMVFRALGLDHLQAWYVFHRFSLLYDSLCTTPSIFHRLKTYLFRKSFPLETILVPTGLTSWISHT